MACFVDERLVIIFSLDDSIDLFTNFIIFIKPILDNFAWVFDDLPLESFNFVTKIGNVAVDEGSFALKIPAVAVQMVGFVVSCELFISNGIF